MDHSGDGQPLALAVDIGGTMMKAGLLRQDGTLLALERRPTPALAPPEEVVRQVVQTSHTLLRQAGLALRDVAGFGVALAGYATTDGVITATAHLSREWIGYNLRARLLQDMQTAYYFALDVPAATLGESYYGAGRGVAHFVYVTVSTGIGAGIMADGEFFRGGLGWAGAVGHIIIDETSPRVCPGCENHGCLETFAATQGVLATTAELLDAHPDSLILRLAGDDRAAITPRLVSEAARQGDPAALEVWRRVGHAFGIGLATLTNIVSPQRIAVGGGIAQADDLLLEPARAVIRERAFPPQHRRAKVVRAALGDLSSLYGAAAMVFYDVRVNPPENAP